MTVTSPQFSRLVASLPSGTLREKVAEGKGIEPLRRYSDRRLASEYLTARSTLRVQREGLDEVSGRMREVYQSCGRACALSPSN